jgi:hypothetical protein
MHFVPSQISNGTFNSYKNKTQISLWYLYTGTNYFLYYNESKTSFSQI